jgi:hypothetical protein
MNSNLKMIYFKAAFTILFLAGTLTCHAADPHRQIPHGKELFTVPESQMTWGETTNFMRADPGGKFMPTTLKVGIRATNSMIVLSGQPLKLVYPASVYIKSVLGRPVWTYPETNVGGVPSRNVDSSNWVSFMYLPLENDRLAVEMTDADGKPVPKTSEGAGLGQTGLPAKVYWRHWGRYGYHGVDLLPHEDHELYPLDPTKYFMIENPGLYKLTLVQRLYVVDTNTYLKAITLPPVTVDVKVADSASR